MVQPSQFEHLNFVYVRAPLCYQTFIMGTMATGFVVTGVVVNGHLLEGPPLVLREK